jgi:hypothetical protein
MFCILLLKKKKILVGFMIVFLAIWIFEQSFSKAVSVFENDERFKAVERDRDRRELFDNYLVELKNKVCFYCLYCSHLL